MLPAGYMLKKIVLRPAGIEADSVIDIYSVSNCISPNLSNYESYWRHNGYWLFDTADIIASITEGAGIDTAELTLFYYELFEQEFGDQSHTWSSIVPDLNFPTAVAVPSVKLLQGYDVSTYSQRNKAECSPLSCCMLAAELSVNRHCLFDTFDEAKTALESGKFENSEPGPFRILAVYTVGQEV